MRWYVRILVGVAALFFAAQTGCIVVSLSPWFTKKDVVHDQRLEGHWQDTDGHARFEVKRGKVHLWEDDVEGYLITRYDCPEEKPSKPMAAVLGDIGETRYLMVTTAPEFEPGPWFAASLHLIFKVDFGDGTLTLVGINPDRVDEQVAKHRFGLDFVCFDDGAVEPPKPGSDPCPEGLLLFTGSVSTLRSFLAYNGSGDTFFSKMGSYTRLKEPKCVPKEKKKEEKINP